MKKILQGIIVLSFPFMLGGCVNSTYSEQKRPNILLVTLDDMGYGTTGVEGCTVPGITPNIDKLASEGILFTYGFVMSPICGPSRSALLSGRYPHCNGVMGHGEQPPPLWQEPDIITPTITRYLHDYGYMTGAIFKHSREINNIWDVKYQELPMGVGFHDRNPQSFYNRVKSFISTAKKNGKPFFLYANPIDPHRPWVDTQQEKKLLSELNPAHPYPPPSIKFNPEDIEVPEFLPDLPEIRKNMVPYYESLHRGDECIGAIMKALEESGIEDNTMVIFLSDHGLGAPGGKATLHHDGIRTPIIVKWSGNTSRGMINRETIVSSIDIMPTILDAIGLPEVEGIEGKSFADFLKGTTSSTHRDYAYAATNYFASSTPDQFFPQRVIIDRSYCYIWNAYIADSPEKRYPIAWMDVVESSLDGSHPALSKKIETLFYKPLEELYKLDTDPGCWNNLANSPDHAIRLQEYRNRLSYEMKSTKDPEYEFFKMQYKNTQ